MKPQGTRGCLVKACKLEKQSGIVWHRLARAFHHGDPPSLPRVPPTKKILKQLPATNQPFVSQRQEVLRNTHGRKQTLKSFPTFFQDSWSSKPSKTSGLSAPKKQLGQRRTFVLARKTTRDRLTEEKSSCVQQREDGRGSDLSVLSSLLMRLISVTGQETGDGGLG